MNRLKIINILILSFFYFIFSGCLLRPTESASVEETIKDAESQESTDVPPTEDQIQSAFLVYVFDSDEDIEKITDSSLNLVGGMAWVRSSFEEFAGVRQTKYQLETETLDSLLQKRNRGLLKGETDSIGTFNRLIVSDGIFGKATKEMDEFEIDALIKKDRKDLLVVRKKEGSRTILQLRNMYDVDFKLGGMSYEFTYQSGVYPVRYQRPNRKMYQILLDLKDDLDSPSNPLYRNSSLSINIPKGQDPDIFIARLKREFGNKYEIKTPFRKMNGDYEVTISHGKEVYQFEYLQNTDSGKFIGAATLNTVRRNLLENPHLLPHGEGTILAVRKGSLDLNEIRKTNEYSSVRVMDQSYMADMNIDRRLLGNRDMELVWVRRKPKPNPPKAKIEVVRQEFVYPKPIAPTKYVPVQPVVNAKEVVPVLPLREVDDLTWDFYLYKDKKTTFSSQYNFSKAIEAGKLGQGGWGGVHKISLDGKKFARKGFDMRMDKAVAKEMAFAKKLGDVGIGPRVHQVNTNFSRPGYIMDIADGDASKGMNDLAMISYGEKQTKLRKMGYISMDDKPANILIKGNEAFMHDFAFMRPNKTGVIPKASDYGTFAPNEARLAPYSDLRRSDYNPGHTQSFFFGFNVLYSRLGEQMDLALRRSGALTRVNRRNVIDGDIVAKALRGKHVEAGMTKKDFDTLLSMLNNNYTSRPTVENFISSFKAARSL